MIARKIVALVIIIYNLVGIFALFGIQPHDLFYIGDDESLLYYTLPVTFIGFGIRWMTSDYIWVIILIQLLILAFTVFIGDLTTRLVLRIFKKN